MIIELNAYKVSFSIDRDTHESMTITCSSEQEAIEIAIISKGHVIHNAHAEFIKTIGKSLGEDCAMLAVYSGFGYTWPNGD